MAQHFELAVHATNSAETMASAVANEARQGCPLVIAGGGDGTVNVVVNALAGTDAALGILPIGTANDFAEQLGLPRDAEDAARRIVAGKAERFDLVAVNGRRFCTVGGVGLVTECAMTANRLKAAGHPFRPVARGLGSTIYSSIAVAKILFGGRCRWNLTAEWTNRQGETTARHRVDAHAFFFANQRGIGGTLTLPAEARNDDGVVDICVLQSGHRLRLLRTVLALRMAWAVHRDVIGVHQASRGRIDSEVELGFLGDGELLCRGKHFELEVLPGALSVVR